MDEFAQYMQCLDLLSEQEPEFKRVMETILGGEPEGDDEEIEVECIELDGKDYMIETEVQAAGTHYLFMMSLENPMDVVVRRVAVEDDGEYLELLDSKEELELVCMYVTRKYLMMARENLLAQQDANQ